MIALILFPLISMMICFLDRLFVVMLILGLDFCPLFWVILWISMILLVNNLRKMPFILRMSLNIPILFLVA